jgi:hypothetical protein
LDNDAVGNGALYRSRDVYGERVSVGKQLTTSRLSPFIRRESLRQAWRLAFVSAIATGCARAAAGCHRSKGVSSACRQTVREGLVARLQCLQHADARTYFRFGAVERFCDNGAVAIDTQHFKELAIFISGPGAHWDLP